MLFNVQKYIFGSALALDNAAHFFVNVGILATWVSRIPAVKDHVGINDGQQTVFLLPLYSSSPGAGSHG